MRRDRKVGYLLSLQAPLHSGVSPSRRLSLRQRSYFSPLGYGSKGELAVRLANLHETTRRDETTFALFRHAQRERQACASALSMDLPRSAILALA